MRLADANSAKSGQSLTTRSRGMLMGKKTAIREHPQRSEVCLAAGNSLMTFERVVSTPSRLQPLGSFECSRSVRVHRTLAYSSTDHLRWR